MPQIDLSVDSAGIRIANLLKEAGLVSSTSDGMRMIKQGAVKIGGEKVADIALVIESGAEMVIQVGKRKWAKVNT
jgi:tyrosyl-tRNA synthetase